VTENGLIRQHEGFQGSARLGGTTGNVLNARPNADFTVPGTQIASIQVGITVDGDDVLIGGEGDDTLEGSEGDDVLEGGEGNDVLLGGIGNDFLFGGAGDDILAGGGGTDIIDGGEGNDTNSFQGIGIGVTATVAADGSGTAVYGGVNEAFTGIENLTGSDNDDILKATGAAANILIGGAGDDILAGGGGTDIIDGGEGNDTNSFQGIGIGVTATLNDDGTGSADYGSVAETFVNIENLLGSENDDVLTAVGNVTGILDGAGGNDLLNGGVGTTLIGGDGADSTSVDFGDEAVFLDLTNSASGLQILDRNSGESQTIEGFETIELQTGDFRDVIRIFATASANLQQITIDAGNGDNFINGWRSDLILDVTTGSGNDVIWTGTANDVVSSGEGSDIIWTNSGNDDINAGNGNNRIFAGQGDDTVVSGSGRDIVYGSGGDDFIDAGAGNDRIFGSSGNDTLIGGEGNDALFGGWGDDTLDGGEGNDVAYGHLGDDTIEGGIGDDRLFGGFGDDTLNGGDGNDWVIGNAGNDILIGGSGNDRIWGGTGRDLLFGGSGSDDLFAGTGDDLLIDGNTTLDTSQIKSVRSEWASDRSIEVRLANITDGTGSADRLNDDAFLNASTLEADEDRDRLFGQSGIDAFFASATDRTFRSAFESLLDL
ncbi:MAG: calcium-binding protein, partial [Fuerstiella sp.]